MAVTQSATGRAYSSGGNQRLQRLNFTAASGDTSATLIFPSLIRVSSLICSTLKLTAVTYNGDNSVTITFVDPTTNVVGVAEARGP